MSHFTPAAESHVFWPWMNAPAFGRLSLHMGVSQVPRALPGAPPEEP